MKQQNSMGIVTPVPGRPSLRICTAATLSRFEFMLSQFKEFNLIDSDTVQLRFSIILPRAQSLIQSINYAMLDSGLAPCKGSVQISVEQEHLMHSLFMLFVPVQPELTVLSNPLRRQKTFAYYCTQAFIGQKGGTAKGALADAFQIKSARPIEGVLIVRDEIFHLLITALRKAACSPITSAAHSALHLATPTTVDWLVDTVFKALSAHEFRTAEDVMEEVRTALTQEEAGGVGRAERPDSVLLRTLFKLFTDQDWYDMLCYFFIWRGAVAGRRPSRLV